MFHIKAVPSSNLGTASLMRDLFSVFDITSKTPKEVNHFISSVLHLSFLQTFFFRDLAFASKYNSTMVVFNDGLRGHGVKRDNRAFYVRHPDQVELARTPFSQSPPPYTSNILTMPPNDEERLFQLRIERRASLPYQQLLAQVRVKRAADP